MKMIRDEFSLHRAFVNSFLDEARIVSRLKHRNIVQLHELGMHGQRIFIAMERLVGQTLLELAEVCSRRRTRLPLAAMRST